MRGRKADKRGRSKGSLDPFVPLERYMLQSVAWRSLSATARATYVELAYGYTGTNNGRIQGSAQVIGDRLGMNKSTASRAIAELISNGFVEVVRASSFTQKLKAAAEYRLTAFKCDVTGTVPSRHFMRWVPDYSATKREASL